MSRLPSRSNLSFTLSVLAVLILALAIRLLYWSDAKAYSVGADEPDYLLPAQTLAREGVYIDTYVSRGRPWTRVPMTSVFFAGSFLLVPDAAAAQAEGDDAALMQPRYDALNLAQIAASLVTVGLIMLLAARIFPQRARPAALVSGFISAIYPPLASSPAQRALSEPLSITLILLAIYTFSWWSPALPLRKTIGIAVLTGLILGIASLVRSVALAFVPFCCLWLLIVYIIHIRDESRRSKVEAPELSTEEPQPHTQYAIRNTHPASRFTFDVLRFTRLPLLTSLALVAAYFLAISPWTYYNYRQYGSFLLLETANATAYWNYHNYRGEILDERMAPYPDPADRLSLIMSEGTANILEYPDKAIAGSIFAFRYFWHLESNSAVLLNPWDMTQREPDVPDLLHSDLLFVLVGLAGVCGLAGVGLRRPVDLAGRTRLLSNLWLLNMVLLGIVVPYDGRYRLPAVPLFIILAAGLLVTADWRAIVSPKKAIGLLKQYPKVAIISALLCAWVLWGAYTPNIPPLLRSIYQTWRGDLALSSGNASDAFGRYGLAQQAFPTFFWPYRHAADEAREQGRADEARALYAQSRDLNPEDPYGILGFADLTSQHPEWILTPDERDWLRRDEADWRGNPWNSFQPSPTTEVDVGTGREIGYIRGFHLPDRPSTDLDYRWTRGRSTIRIPIPPGTTYNAITLRMSAPSIGPSTPISVSISIDGSTPTNLNVPPGWADYTLSIPPGKTLTIEVVSATRTPSKLEPNSNDNRNLGVGIERISLIRK
ncbi:MAG TPA: hypothetical protein VEX13_03340 [Chloroflexia bacterium]|nr:hypothetical protein [Chloroflexia bacterium]